MRIESERHHGDLFLRLSGRFDAHETQQFRGAVEAEAGAPSGDVRLDLSNVIFIDSSALAELVSLYRNLERENHSLVIEEVSDPVRIILELTNLDQVFAAKTASPPSSGA